MHPQEFEERVIRKFLWFPMEFGNTKQTDWRWLTIAYIRQQYCEDYDAGKYVWKDIRFESKDWKTKAAIKKMSDSAK